MTLQRLGCRWCPFKECVQDLKRMLVRLFFSLLNKLNLISKPTTLQHTSSWTPLEKLAIFRVAITNTQTTVLTLTSASAFCVARPHITFHIFMHLQEQRWCRNEFLKFLLPTIITPRMGCSGLLSSLIDLLSPPFLYRQTFKKRTKTGQVSGMLDESRLRSTWLDRTFACPHFVLGRLFRTGSFYQAHVAKSLTIGLNLSLHSVGNTWNSDPSIRRQSR